MEHNPNFDVAAIYFPSWHVDPINEKFHGTGWTEWELVKAAKPLYPGHHQPRVPTWGHFDETDPEYAARQIDLAADHGVTVFHMDWYWYNNAPYLNRALKALLDAPNSHRIKFGIMWANHDWANIFPMKRTREKPLMMASEYNQAAMDDMIQYLIEHFFTHPSVWKLDGKPVFTVYNLNHMAASIGVEGAKRLFASFREQLLRAGLPDLHLNAMGDYFDVEDHLVEMGIASATNYQTIWDFTYGKNISDPQSVFDARSPKRQNYVKSLDLAQAHWETMRAKLNIPYYPVLTHGWDSSPRAEQFEGASQMDGYPWYPVVENNTPANFEIAAAKARDFILKQPTEHKIVYVNAWNEWTEGSYLLPDERYGNGYLEALKRVFVKDKIEV
ncbi:glycosyltransferase WbsX family protein [Cohnella silvisoli]|uniref:Glycoside hydrolase family 99-like domain-containing protein n=1 Tax=Cohnella silvisoli TaxID=2873699 RepID=A0ABV1KM06_9BACL|nr:glycoside hydrolase family 99-like domain-containing protein [Cohnella silvisoli]MCD9020537.1 glycoside hydrolase family 99-like domain-containing protein [Cohnella silvisoli]